MYRLFIMQQFTTHICIFIWSHHSVTSNIYLTGGRMHRQEYHLSVPLRIGRGRKKTIIDVSFFEFFCPHWIILLNWLLLFGYPFSFPSELSVILVKFWLDRNSTNLFLLYIQKIISVILFIMNLDSGGKCPIFNIFSWRV